MINVSASGALVESKCPCAVGTTVGLQTEGSFHTRLEGRITRCQVSTVHRDGTMTYQLAIAFAEAAQIDVPREAAGGAGGQARGATGILEGIDASVEALTNQW